MSVELWWLHDNEREDSGQVTPDEMIVAAASLVLLVGVTGVACVCCCAESCRRCLRTYVLSG